jgi:NAD(P)-dependent dehydrogenase (short-subunit alcohol dehydrogenase family)
VTVAGFDSHMAVNLRAPLLLAQAFAVALEPAIDRGGVVNILDQKLSNMNPDFVSYTLRKAGLAAATTMLAQALAPRIRVVGVAPGLTLGWARPPKAAALCSPSMPYMRRRRSDAARRRSTPLDIAGAVPYLVGADAITGETLLVDGGQHLQPSPHDVMFELETE